MNPIVKYGGLLLLALIFLLIIRGCGDGIDDVAIREPSHGQTTGTTALETTAGEELRTVGSRQQRTDGQVQSLQGKVEELQAKIETFEGPKNGQSQEVNGELEALRKKVEQLENEKNSDNSSNPKLDVLQQEFTELKELVSTGGNSALHVATNGLKESDSKNPLDAENDYEVTTVQTFEKEEMIWIGPVDEPDLVQNGKIVWDELSQYWSDTAERLSEQAQTTKDDAAGIKVFTLPANSTLRGARLSGRMLGRIPGDGGTVEQPYGFKVVVPPESFIANGHDLPEISHAFMAGFATGDLGLRCARGYITNMTFVFEDGTISQIGEPSTNSGGDTEYLAVLTDEASTECIRGELKTDFVEYVTTSGLLSAAEAAAQGAVASQTTNTSEGGSSSSSVTGSSGVVIAGSAGAGMVSDTKQWVNERWSKTFDAILVEIGRNVQIETKAQIEIDYDPTGRRIRHLDEQSLQELMQ
ncbi:TIGR03752 family integrating conjugative element protein [Vibrio campbellii]|uniref:TIGR03752 family integrating conjugative element protein n=1 Tax=Vibrio campbellii TaxID=680 RepID=UPI00215C9A97|nr:TIGR03752 family integrating conjugative element protein [Vibrio campbellii]MCR9909673.1 TIGR03752 family integrating conjugative element protein [Vibrio campbellii]